MNKHSTKKATNANGVPLVVSDSVVGQEKGGPQATAVTLWKTEQLEALSHTATKRQIEIFSRVPPAEAWEHVSRITTLNYQPDQAVRAAILAPDAWKPWKKNWRNGEDTEFLAYHHAPNDLRVYLGGPRPPTVQEGELIVEDFRLSMVVTGRIALSIWRTRRYENQLTLNGSAAIKLDEILAIRGVKKASTILYHGEHHDIRYSNGYRWTDKQAIVNDLVALQQCYVHGGCVVYAANQWKKIGVDDQYLRFSLITEELEDGRQERVGIFVNAGDWINVYETNGNLYVAQVERAVFRLNMQNEQHELLIGLYLTERWRDLAKKQDYTRPLSMMELLDGSVIRFDRKNPSRFIMRIQHALDVLYEKGILGARAICVNPPDRTVSRWTNAWLTSQWILTPPQDLVHHYQSIAATSPSPNALSLAKRRKGKRAET